MSEDSLTLNVWTPAAAEDRRLPVMVWFHGGGYSSGTGAESMFYGETLAQSGRAVVVTVNHRLGILGYTPLGHLLGSDYSSSGSAGIADLVVALEWVRDNIAGLGGDPANVTIFGQSGGGAKVCTLLGAPAASNTVIGSEYQFTKNPNYWKKASQHYDKSRPRCPGNWFAACRDISHAL